MIKSFFCDVCGSEKYQTISDEFLCARCSFKVWYDKNKDKLFQEKIK